MSSGADLFVVCKQCGSEVSPYITECPYCGHRLRRRAPKLPREHALNRSPRGLSRARLRLRPRNLRPSPSRAGSGRFRRAREFGAGSRPYATIALVAASCGAWVAWHAKPGLYADMAIIGPLHGDWWKLFTSLFAYGNGLYAFVTLVAVAIFGWLLERRHGPAVVLGLFLGAGATGALVSIAVYSDAIVSGANGAALALLAAWAVPDLEAARSGSYYEGDLLGTGAIAAVLLAMPFALAEASWLSGITGAALGLVLGLGLSRIGGEEL
jgi:membrane associated rhomboid family serine protease